MLKIRGFFLICAVTCSGCSSLVTQGSGAPVAQMTFEHIEPYALDVEVYNVVNKVSNDISALDAGFLIEPMPVIFGYFNQRYEANGLYDSLEVQLTNLHVSHDVVESPSSMIRSLGMGREDRYIMDVSTIVNYDHEGRNKKVSLSFFAHRELLISEGASIVEREEAQMKSLMRLIHDLDTAIRNGLMRDLKILE